MEDIFEKQSHFFEYVNNSINMNKKVSHAYLIETNGYPDYKKLVLEFIKIILLLDKTEPEKSKINTLIDNNNYPDLKFIYPDGNYIKKEQLISLENQYSKKSMLNNKLIYVIDPADKLNLSSANTILKFLEEPPVDIIAILVTESKHLVLDTIVSRCQCLSLNSCQELNFVDEIKDFVKEVENPRNILIKYDYYIEKLFNDRGLALENLKLIEECLFQELKKILGNKNTEKSVFIIRQIELIEKEKEKLQYNLNLKLWFSSYIFSIMEVVNNV